MKTHLASLAVIAAVVLSAPARPVAQSLPSGWSSQDIGPVVLPGSATQAGATFTVRGSGADIWGTADAFHFVDQLLVGDGEIVARVASMTNTHTYAKAGVMIRESLTAGSRHVLLDVKPNGGVEFLARSATGGSTAYVAGGTGPWLRLVRAGSTFTAYVSSDGAAWTTVGSRAVTMGVNVWVGLAVCSHTTSTLNTATFDHVAVTPAGSGQPPTVSLTSPASGATFAAGTSVAIAASAVPGAEPVASVDFYASDGTADTPLGTDTTSPYTFTWTNVPAGSYSLTAVATDTAGRHATSAVVAITVTAAGGGGLPQGWASQDIGAVGLAGSAGHDGGTFTVRGAGADIWGSADAFHFVNRRLSGDGEIVARVQSLENTHAYAKAGVMIRESLTSGSRHVLLDLKPGGGVELLARYQTGSTTTFEAAGSGRWLKLVRRSTVFSAFVSNDGTAWTMIGSAAIGMTPDVWVGLAVCSHDTRALNASLFDNIAVGDAGGGMDRPPTVSITSPQTNSTHAAGTNITLTASAADDIGVARVEFYVNPGTGNVHVATDTTSPYSVTWTNVGAGFYTLAAVVTDTGGQRAYSPPVNVAVTAGGTPGLPQGWTSRDIGAVGVAGSASFVADSFTVRGAGADIWGGADGFHFAHSALAGDGMISARVASMDNTHAYAKAGLMIRETLTAGSRHVLLNMKPSGTVEFLVRETPGGPTIYVGGGTGRDLKLVRNDGVFYAYVSENGVTWSLIGRRAVTMASNVSAGLAVSSHNTAVLNTSVFETVWVRPKAAGTSLRIVSPPDATFPPDTDMVLTVDADPATIGQGRVELHVDSGTGPRIANYWLLPGPTADSRTSVFVVFGLPAGAYTFTAVVEGVQYFVSNPVRISVSPTASGPVPPTIRITNPGPDEPVVPGTLLTAAVTDPDSAAVRVDYYAELYYFGNGAAFIGSATVSPYAVPWPSLDEGPGNYWVFAVATDSTGLATATGIQVWR